MSSDWIKVKWHQFTNQNHSCVSPEAHQEPNNLQMPGKETGKIIKWENKI